jgi:hypothetical protein
MWGLGTALGGAMAWLLWKAMTGQEGIPTTETLLIKQAKKQDPKVV